MELDAASTTTDKRHTLVASTGITRIDTSSTIGGYQNFDTSNRFRYYQELAVATPHVSTSLLKLGLTLTKGMTFDGDSTNVVDEFETWSGKVNLLEQVQTLARLLCRDGTYVATTPGKAETLCLTPLLMPNVTILPEGVAPRATPQDVMIPPIKTVVVNESDAKKQTVLDNVKDRLVIGTINAWDIVQKDVMGRDTYGIYGASLMEPIELSIRNLLNVNYGYVSFVQKYGNGRYVFNFELLEKLVEQELISIDDAQTAIDNWMEEHKHLKQNEDIIGAGLSVVPIDANGTLDVLSFKKSLETDIQIGLLQSPLSMGDTKGSTYAAGYVSEEDRMVALEGLQKVVTNVVNQFVNHRLTLMGKAEDTVWIEFDELSKPKMESGDVLEWYNSGLLSKEAALKWGGFPVEGQ